MLHSKLKLEQVHTPFAWVVEDYSNRPTYIGPDDLGKMCFIKSTEEALVVVSRSPIIWVPVTRSQNASEAYVDAAFAGTSRPSMAPLPNETYPNSSQPSNYDGITMNDMWWGNRNTLTNDISPEPVAGSAYIYEESFIGTGNLLDRTLSSPVGWTYTDDIGYGVERYDYYPTYGLGGPDNWIIPEVDAFISRGFCIDMGAAPLDRSKVIELEAKIKVSDTVPTPWSRQINSMDFYYGAEWTNWTLMSLGFWTEKRAAIGTEEVYDCSVWHYDTENWNQQIYSPPVNVTPVNGVITYTQKIIPLTTTDAIIALYINGDLIQSSRIEYWDKIIGDYLNAEHYLWGGPPLTGNTRSGLIACKIKNTDEPQTMIVNCPSLTGQYVQTDPIPWTSSIVTKSVFVDRHLTDPVPISIFHESSENQSHYQKVEASVDGTTFVELWPVANQLMMANGQTLTIRTTTATVPNGTYPGGAMRIYVGTGTIRFGLNRQ